MTTRGVLWGEFSGVVNTDWLRSAKGEDRAMLLTDRCSLSFRRPNGEIVKAEPWLVFDGQSIPMWAWFPLAMSPFTGKSRDAAVIHDTLCKMQDRPYQDAHRVYYEGCRARGMWFRGRIMYHVLLWFGTRWP